MRRIHVMKRIGVLFIIMALCLIIGACGNESGRELDDTSNQVIPGEDWKGIYKDVDSTYVDVDSLSETDKSFPDKRIFILEIDVSGTAYLTLDPDTANTLARKADDYTKITTFDVKWTEEDDSLIMHAPGTNIKQMVCSRMDDGDDLELELQFETTSEIIELEPVDVE